VHWLPLDDAAITEQVRKEPNPMLGPAKAGRHRGRDPAGDRQALTCP